MVENKPDGRYGKATYIAPAIVGMIVVALVANNVLDRSKPESPPAATRPAGKPATDLLVPVTVTPSVVMATPALSRNEMVEEANAASSRFATEGRMPLTAQLVGRTFSVRIAF